MTNRAHELCLRVLGVEVTLKFTALAAAEQAAAMFHALIIEPWRTPDVVIECDWPRLDRRFIRSRTATDSEVLEGVRVFSKESPDGAEWSSADPPFPPVDAAPFRGRFARLHAGAVIDEAGRALLILGESGMGKSTLCFQLADQHGFSLLTDEDAFVHLRSTIVEPYAVGHAPWKASGERPGPARAFTLVDNPGLIESVLLLRPTSPSIGELTPVGQRACMSALLQGQRPGGAAHSEVIATLAALAKTVRAAELPGGRYDRLLTAAGDVVAFAREGGLVAGGWPSVAVASPGASRG